MVSRLLLEDGSALRLEDGYDLLLEDSEAAALALTGPLIPSGAVAYGPASLTLEDDPPVGVWALQVFRRPDMVTPVAVPTAFGGVHFEDEFNDTGRGQCWIQADDDQAPLINMGDLVQIVLYGIAVFTFVVEQRVTVRAKAQGLSARRYLLGGRGHLCTVEEFVVYAASGVDKVPWGDDRSFGWRSIRYNDLGWDLATEIAQQSLPSALWTGQPSGWPVGAGEAKWIWDDSSSDKMAKPGICYFRRYITVPDGVTQIVIYFAADNAATVWLDEEQVGQTANTALPFQTAAPIITVTQGLHLIAVQVTNDSNLFTVDNPVPPPPPVPLTYTVVSGDTLWGIATRYYGSGFQWPTIYNANQALIQSTAEAHGLWDPSDPGHWIFPGEVFTIPGLTGDGLPPPAPAPGEPVNPAGFLCSVWTYGPEGPIEPFVQSDSNWSIVAYADPPGVSAGAVERLVADEAYSRGGFGDIGYSFDEGVVGTHDTAGAPWALLGDISTKVGYTYLTLLRELTGTYVDVRMQPGALILDMWNKDTRGSEKPSIVLLEPTDPADEQSGNITQLQFTEQYKRVNAVLSRWTGGWHERLIPGLDLEAHTARKEGTIGIGSAQSVAEVERLQDAQLAIFANPRILIAVEYDPRDESETPYLAFEVGDWITVPDLDGTPVLRRVLAITVDQDPASNRPIFKPFLGDQ